MFNLINQYRQSQGLPPLKLSRTLSGAAEYHSEDMIARQYFDHFDPDGFGPSKRCCDYGYKSACGKRGHIGCEEDMLYRNHCWRSYGGSKLMARVASS